MSKQWPIVLMFVGALVLTVAGQETGQKELDKLQGRWKPVKMVANGKPAPEDALAQIEMIVQGNRMTTKLKGKVIEEFTFKIDSSKTPKTMDSTIVSIGGKGPETGTVVPCIYDLNGDLLKLAIPGKKEDRPKDFNVPEKGQRVLIHLKRVAK